MKKLVALLAVLGFVPCAYAADGADFSHSGDFRLQYMNDMNADGVKDAGADGVDQNWAQRLRWGTTVRAGEKMTGHFTLVHNGNWGENTDQIPGPATLAGANMLLVNEAYMAWMASDSLVIKAGRGSFTMADGRLVSSNDFDPVQRAFDGAMATWDQEFARLSFFAVEGADLGTNLFGRFYGVSADFKSLPDFLKTANLHYLMINTDKVVGAVDSEASTRIGLVVAGDTAGVDYRATYEMYSGETHDNTTDAKTDISSSMMDLEAGYSLPSMMNSRFYVGYHTDTGTKASSTKNETYDGFHYDAHTNAGLMDIFNWGNLTYMRVGASMVPADSISVALEYLMFSQTEKDGAINANGAWGGAGDTTKDTLGSELDLTVTKKYTNNFNISASYRTFAPGDEYKAGGQKDSYDQMYLESKLTF